MRHDGGDVPIVYDGFHGPITLMPDDHTIADSVAGLASPAADVRAAAAEALCHAAHPGAAVPLVRATGDDDERVREWAVAALEDLGPPPVDAIPALTTIAGEPRPLPAYWAITLLGRSGKDAVSAVGVLTGCLGSSEASVAQRAAWALGKLGPVAAASRAALDEARRGADPRLARLASDALGEIGEA